MENTIDNYDYEVVGVFAGRVVYHPLEDIHFSDSDLTCGPRQLLMGGDGQTSPIILKNAMAAVAHFALESGSFSLKPEMRQALEEHWNGKQDNIALPGWKRKNIKELSSICQSSAMRHKHRPKGGESLNEFLNLNFGSFIYYLMPEIAGELALSLKALENGSDFGEYCNIAVLPSQIPVFGAKHSFTAVRSGDGIPADTSSMLDIDVLWGGYYTYQEDNGKYAVFRLLDFNKDAFHHALYSEDFGKQPTLDQVKALKPFIGHVPQAIGAIMNMRELELLGSDPLTEQDLSGYRYYLNDCGADDDYIDEMFGNLKQYNQEPALQLRLKMIGDDIEVLRR